MAILTINANGGIIKKIDGWQISEDGTYATKTIESGSTYGELPMPAYDKFNFIGWIDSLGNIVTKDTTMPNEDITLYAKWRYVVYPSDYVNLKETLSEKNIINSVDGKEYEINNAQETTINQFSISPNVLDDLFLEKPYTGTTTKNAPNLSVNFGKYEAKSLIGIHWGYAYGRTETIFLVGSYEFTTEEVITDVESISCRFTLNYTKSDADAIIEENYNDFYRTSFFDLGSQFPLKNSQELSTNDFLEANQGVASYKTLFKTLKTYLGMPTRTEYCKPIIVNRTQSSTTIKIKYCFRVWAGRSISQTESEVLCVNSIDIETFANTVDKIESPFFYQDNENKTSRNYDLETNELFQIKKFNLASVDSDTEGTYYIKTKEGYSQVLLPDEYDETLVYYSYDYMPEQERLSYKTYEKIIDAYDTDRRIITFELLNPIKMVINDSDKYTRGDNMARYLDADDEFSIYNEHNEYIGDFKVIQCNPIWDGAYHKIITAMILQ